MRSATGSRTWRAFHCSVSEISAGDAMASATSLRQRRGDAPNQSTTAETTESLIITNNSFRNTNPSNHRIELWYQQAADRSDQTERERKKIEGGEGGLGDGLITPTNKGRSPVEVGEADLLCFSPPASSLRILYCG
jgi:hypothetical protein